MRVYEKTADVAHGRWREILPKLGVSRKCLTGDNGPCPACGGKDRFRFTDRYKDGDYFCNQCGAGKGVKLVMKTNGWDFKTAVRAIDNVLGNKSAGVVADKAHLAAIAFFEKQPDMDNPWEPPRSTREATLWLKERYPERLPEWLACHDPMLAIWLQRIGA